MLRYETLLLATPEITKDETTLLEKQVDQLIKKAKGAVISFDRWGKYRLAYPVRKNEYGVYFLVRFEVEHLQAAQLIEDLNALFAFKKSDIIMRNMITRLDEHASLAYHKPESLEDNPTRDVDMFLRENNMESLLQKPHDKHYETKGSTFDHARALDEKHGPAEDHHDTHDETTGV